MACNHLRINPDELWPRADPGDWFKKTSIYDREVARMEIVKNECVVPSTVQPGEVFQIKYVYRFCTEEYRCKGWHHQPAGTGIPCPPLEDLGNWHGGFRAGTWGLYPVVFYHHFWVWRLLNMKAYHQDVNVETHTRDTLSPGDKFTYTWQGTIEELTGQEFTEPTTVIDHFEITGFIYGYYGNEALGPPWNPWSWPLEVNWIQEHWVDGIDVEIYVDVPPPPPPPPTPIFNRDLCAVLKDQVSPTEQFGIRISIDNPGDGEGYYYIGCFCEGSYLELADGTINKQSSKTFPLTVTANQLAKRQITESQYLSFTITVGNEDQETSRWTPAAIIVTVSATKANLNGRVTDKVTEQALAGVLVSLAGTGSSTSTGSDGRYTLEGLEPGAYTISFTKSGYWDVTKSKTLVVGNNTLYVELTPETEPPPGQVNPWLVVGAAGAGMAALLLLRPKKKKEVKK